MLFILNNILFLRTRNIMRNREEYHYFTYETLWMILLVMKITINVIDFTRLTEDTLFIVRDL